ncbi:unnamed protein product [Lasius platythorax]|uniref:HAT C-terminal dimerisation domain-containing protein n=1 Tax=Lasius platythorax TaxID=488582 RepID=A0AAV2N0B0_9HYME
MNSKKHQDIIKYKNSISVSFVDGNVTKARKRDVSAVTLSNPHSKRILQPVSSVSSHENRLLFESCTNVCMEHCCTKTSAVTQQGKLTKMKNFVLTDETSKAEIMWCLNAVMRHNSLKDVESSVSLMKTIFLNSDIVKRMNLCKDKASYTITYGITKHFQKELYLLIQKSNELVISFDKSLNKLCQKEQMDIVVRFWDDEKNETSTRYMTSTFFGHTTAIDLLEAIKGCVPLDMLKKMTHISMDGPNVNFKFLRDLKLDLFSDPEDKKLLDLGNCGLHTMHCAFKAGINATKWNIIEFLWTLHNLFKNVPVQKADYISASGSADFSLKFCGIRWLKNIAVAERARVILPNVRKYVMKVTKEETISKCASFETVSTALGDTLLVPKLTFFQSLASDVQPFMSEFQSDHPLTPFLHDAIYALVRSLMERFVKDDVLKETDLYKIDVTKKDNLVTTKYIKVGYATEAALKHKKGVLDLQILQFKNQVSICLQIFVDKIMVRSPLKFPLTKSVSCMDPAIASRGEIAYKRLFSALRIYVENNLISGITADKIDREYRHLIGIPVVQEKFQTFKRSEIRLDNFWVDLITSCGKKDYENLSSFMKSVMILSHGNAAVERSFSVNKECLVENQKEKSLIAQKIIYDTVNAKGGLVNFIVTKDLIHAARNAHMWYKEELARENREKRDAEEMRDRRKRAAKVLRELEAKKRQILDDAVKETARIDDEIKVAQKL